MPRLDSPPPKQKIGNYRLIRKLGQGGMGEVYEARHEGVGGRAAIKILRLDADSSPNYVARFFDEARAANSVEHPSIIRIFDSGQTDDQVCYLAMEFLDGETLAHRIKVLGTLSISSATRFARQIASALAAVHARGVVHRDLKPENLMVVKDPESAGGERIKVLDFGIARLAADLRTRDGQTESGLILGTPMYMSPEQCHGARQVEPPSDVYSLGIILYKMLAGRAPFVSKGQGALIAMHLSDEPPPIETFNAKVPAVLSALLGEMLAKSAADRPTMEAVEQRLRAMSNAEDLPAPHSRSETATRKISVLDPKPDVQPSAKAQTPAQPTQPLHTLVLPQKASVADPTNTQPTSPQRRTRRLIHGLLAACGVAIAGFVLLFHHASPAPSPMPSAQGIAPTQAPTARIQTGAAAPSVDSVPPQPVVERSPQPVRPDGGVPRAEARTSVPPGRDLASHPIPQPVAQAVSEDEKTPRDLATAITTPSAPPSSTLPTAQPADPPQPPPQAVPKAPARSLPAELHDPFGPKGSR